MRTSACLCACLAVAAALEPPTVVAQVTRAWSGVTERLQRDLPWSRASKRVLPEEPPPRKPARKRRGGPGAVTWFIILGVVFLAVEQGLASPENNLVRRLATLRPGNFYTPREVAAGLYFVLLLPAIAVASFLFVIARALGLVKREEPEMPPSPDDSPVVGANTAYIDLSWNADDSAFKLDDPDD